MTSGRFQDFDLFAESFALIIIGFYFIKVFNNNPEVGSFSNQFSAGRASQWFLILVSFFVGLIFWSSWLCVRGFVIADTVGCIYNNNEILRIVFGPY